VLITTAEQTPTMSVELGFAETPEGPLTADKFPSKVGGIPV